MFLLRLNLFGQASLFLFFVHAESNIFKQGQEPTVRQQNRQGVNSVWWKQHYCIGYWLCWPFLNFLVQSQGRLYLLSSSEQGRSAGCSVYQFQVLWFNFRQGHLGNKAGVYLSIGLCPFSQRSPPQSPFNQDIQALYESQTILVHCIKMCKIQKQSILESSIYIVGI